MSEIIYHYTSVEVLAKILESQKFRFTHMRSLNDTSEYLYGLQLLKDKITDYEQLNNINTPFDVTLFDKFFFLNDLCSVSFTKNRDDYGFWNSYYVPKNGGVAIGFERHCISDGRYIINDCMYGDPYPKIGKDRYDWFKWVFDVKYLKRLKDREFIHITFQTAHIKHQAFKPENEIRAVSFLPKDKNEQSYFERDEKTIQCYDQPFNIGSIREVIIGPSSTSQNTVLLVKNILSKYNVVCNISSSNIPLSL